MDGDAYVSVPITPDPTYHGCTSLSEFMPLHFPSPTRTPLVAGEDVRSAPRPEIPRRQASTPLSVLAAPRSNALHKHKTTCIEAAPMSPMTSPFEANRGMPHLPRCAPTKPPDPLRTDDLPRQASSPCNTEETQDAQRILSYIRVLPQRRPTSPPPSTRLRGRPPLSSASHPITMRSLATRKLKKKS
jgi:hypothetical protein